MPNTIVQFFNPYTYITLHDKRVLFLERNRSIRLSIFEGGNILYLNKEICGGRFFNFIDD